MLYTIHYMLCCVGFCGHGIQPHAAAPRPQVQKTIGVSDYVRRDMALKNLIQPLAGEYGMHNNQPQRECLGWLGERVGRQLGAWCGRGSPISAIWQRVGIGQWVGSEMLIESSGVGLSAGRCLFLGHV